MVLRTIARLALPACRVGATFVRMIGYRPFIVALVLVFAGCSSSSPESSSDVEPSAAVASTGIRLVSPTEGAAIEADPPADLVVLDVRTPEEFAEGHLEGAVLVDFYDPDFADQLAELEPDVPYLLYCRSGNRSGQTTALMADLGFTDVADIDGGIVAWEQQGLPVVR